MWILLMMLPLALTWTVPAACRLAKVPRGLAMWVYLVACLGGGCWLTLVVGGGVDRVTIFQWVIVAPGLAFTVWGWSETIRRFNDNYPRPTR